MSKVKLLFDLILYVNAKRRFTAQDVANEFDISVRTAHRYLNDISEMGVPLYTEPGRSGGYRILNNRLLPPIMFDEDEAFAIFFAFQSLKYYESLPFDININSVSRKLYANLPRDGRTKMDQLDTVLSFWNKKRIVPAPFLKEIIEAAAESQVLYIEYDSKSENTFREVCPIGVYAYDGFWYMPAFDWLHDEIRLFRLDRIVSLANTHKQYDPKIRLVDWLNIQAPQTPKNPLRLYVELTRDGIRNGYSQPWLAPHIVIRSSEQGYVDTMIDKSEIDFTSRYFLQLGTSAKVKEPREIVDRIRELLEDMTNHYS